MIVPRFALPATLAFTVAFATLLYGAQQKITAQDTTIQAQRKRLDSADTSLKSCTTTVAAQQRAIKSMRDASEAASASANSRLLAVQGQLSSAEARVAALRRLPTPPPAAQCDAIEALLNEVSNVPR